MTLETHALFGQGIDLASTRIKNFPSKIFLCGGAYHEDPSKGGSVRHQLIHHLKAENQQIAGSLILAETANDWFDDELFSDLLELERMLAGISTTVALFVESAGSIAELGAFCLLPNIKKKLFVVLESTHAAGRSFITLGPVRSIDKRQWISAPWYAAGSATDIDPNRVKAFLPDVVDELASALMEQPKEQVFQADDDGHVMLLVASIASVLTISDASEIKSILSMSGIDISDRKVKQYIYVLRKMDMVTLIPYLRKEYYISTGDNISFGFNADTPTNDIIRWKGAIMDEYESRKDKRLNALSPEQLPQVTAAQ